MPASTFYLGLGPFLDLLVGSAPTITTPTGLRLALISASNLSDRFPAPQALISQTVAIRACRCLALAASVAAGDSFQATISQIFVSCRPRVSPAKKRMLEQCLKRQQQQQPRATIYIESLVPCSLINTYLLDKDALVSS